jgi:hypothetical protein
MSAPRGKRSKPFVTWLALLGGSLGLHRFYLHGWTDRWGWAFPLPTLVGLYGAWRMHEYGVDDRLAWLLIPLLGITLAIGMLSAIVYGLTPDERWDARFNGGVGHVAAGWGTIVGVMLSLAVGAGIAMATAAFAAQRYYEYQELTHPAASHSDAGRTDQVNRTRLTS